jgi:hypothetical protein
MCDYECPDCGVKFAQKSHLNYHITHDACKTYSYFCKYCDKGFTTSNSMYRHMKHNCKVKKEDDKEKESMLDKLVEKTELEKIVNDNSELRKRMETLEKENKSMKKKLTKLEKEPKRTSIKNIQNAHQINNGTVNTTNNIILVGYGQEDLAKLDKTEIMKALQNGYYSTVKLTETVHFNPKYPEYHNVYISNMKDKYAMIFDGKNWTLTTKEDLIAKIYDDKKNYIEENLEEFVNSLQPSRKRALERWLDTDDDDQKIREIKENIKLLLYNSRQIALDTQSQQKNNIIVRKVRAKDTVKNQKKS